MARDNSLAPMPAKLFFVHATYQSLLLRACALLCLGFSTVRAVVVTGQPDPVVFATAGQSATVHLNATGTGGVSYQWRKFGQSIAGATGSTLTLTNVTPADAGFYDAVVSDGSSSTTSQSCRLEVRPAVNPTALRPKTSFSSRFEISSAVTKVVPMPSGGFYVVGPFTTIDGSTYTGVARFSASGTLDPSFSPPIFDNSINTAALQSDGRLVVGGAFLTVNGQPAGEIARLNLDGTLDTAFNVGSGFTGTTFTDSSVLAIAIQADGKIVVGGTFLQYNGRATGLIARLNTDGTSDTAFSAGGGFSTLLGQQVTALVLQPDGKIIVGGAFTSYGGSVCSTPARLNTNGTLDSTFAAATPYGTGFLGGTYSLALQADGRVIVGGHFLNGSSDVGLYRLTATGTFDSTFGVYPIILQSNSGDFRGIVALAIQSDGRIIVGGSLSSYNNASRGKIMRLNTDGSLDAAFVGTSGFNDVVNALAVEADGRVLCGGYFTSFAAAPRGGLARLNSDGSLGAGATATFRSPGSVAAIVPTAGGKWIAAGRFSFVNGTARGGIAQLNADGSLDAPFANGAGFAYDFGLAAPASLCVQADGKVIVGGVFSRYDGVSRNCLTRLNADGTLDTGFLVGSGIGSTAALAGVDRVRLQSDGRAIVAGYFTSYNGAAAAGVVRLNTNGTLDSTFTSAPSYRSAMPVLLPLADASVLVGGYTLSQNVSSTLLVRLTTSGAIDSAFNPGHLFDNLSFQAAALQPDGRYLIASSFPPTSTLARINPDGSAEPNFRPSLDTGTAIPSVIRNVVVQADGKIVVVGNFTAANGQSAKALARLAADGTTDPTLTVPSLVSNRNLDLTDLVYTADGGLLVAGGRINFTDRVVAGLVALEPVPIPVIVTQPTAQSTMEGGAITLSVSATGESLQYQWIKNGAAIPGATSRTLTVPAASPSDAGSYKVVVSGSGLSINSDVVFVSVVYSRITNASIRSFAGSGDQTLTMGFVLNGGGSKQVLLRGVGPTLASYGVGSPIADPRLQLFTGAGVSVATNNDWSGTTALTNLFTQVNAFPLPANSKDAAVALALAAGAYSAQLSGDTTTGVALIETYDADATNYASKLANVSVRTQVGTGENILIMGFVITGNAPKKLLVRAIGPTLAQFGVGSVLDDPQLEVLDAQAHVIQANDNWGGDVTLQAAFSQSGAFGLPLGSRDGALVLTLQPGLYTVRVSGVANATGVALAEVYELP